MVRVSSAITGGLTVIQQKPMHRKSDTGGFTAFSKAGAAVKFIQQNPEDDEYWQNVRCYVIGRLRSSARDKKTCQSVVTRRSWRFLREQRS